MLNMAATPGPHLAGMGVVAIQSVHLRPQACPTASLVNLAQRAAAGCRPGKQRNGRDRHISYRRQNEAEWEGQGCARHGVRARAGCGGCKMVQALLGSGDGEGAGGGCDQGCGLV